MKQNSVCRDLREVVEKLANSGRLYGTWLGMRFFHIRPRAAARTELTPHLLLMAWAFPPEVGGGVDRPAALAKYAARAGWKVTVIASPLDNPALLAEAPKKVHVIRVPPALRASYRLLPKIDGGFAEMITAYCTALRACRDESPTAIMVSGPPFMTFVTAHFLARRLHVPLVLDYRDEWTICTPHWVAVSPFDEKWERSVLQGAAAVIFVNDAIRDLYLKAIGDLSASKCTVITNGWDQENFSDRDRAVKISSSTAEQRFVISYVGTIGRYTDPTAFLEALGRIFASNPAIRRKLRLRFVGNLQGAAERHSLASFGERFPDTIETIGSVPKDAAIAEICAADGLLLFTDSPRGAYPANEDATLPSKLFEYLAARSAILVFGINTKAAKLVEYLGAGVAVPSDDWRALESALLRLIDESREHWETVERKTWIREYTREALSGRMIAVLEEARPTK